MKKGDFIDNFFKMSYDIYKAIMPESFKWFVNNHFMITVCLVIIIFGSLFNIACYFLPRVQEKWKSIIVWLIRICFTPILAWCTIFITFFVYCIANSDSLIVLFAFPGACLVMLFLLLTIGTLTPDIYQIFEKDNGS